MEPPRGTAASVVLGWRAAIIVGVRSASRARMESCRVILLMLSILLLAVVVSCLLCGWVALLLVSVAS